MTFPQTATLVADVATATELEIRWEAVISGLRQDQPAALEFIDETFRLAMLNSGKYFCSKLPSEVGGRLPWDDLVRRTAEMFASDITRIAIGAWARSLGLDQPHFVCCCGISVGYSLDERIDLGFRNQRLPDAIC